MADNSKPKAPIKAAGIKAEAKQKARWVAAVRVRGKINVRQDMEHTMELLHLHRRNFCVVKPNNPTNIGMLKKVKDYVTFGEIDDETYKLLVDKKAELFKGREKDSKGLINYNKFVVVDKKKIKPFFRLSPPKGGFERKGIKKSYGKGGAAGYRGADMAELIKRML